MLFFLSFLYSLSNIFFTNVHCIIQDLQIIKLPYLSINNNTENLYLRKLSYPSSIYGSAFGLNYYYANLYLGEKNEKQTYIIDTGSSITTSPCVLCKKCGEHLNNYFSIEEDSYIPCNSNKCKIVKSQCGSNNQCSFYTSYSEGSTLEGVFVNKLIKFGDENNLSEGHYAPIGCTTTETHLFLTQRADGIMGLANNDYNFVSLMYKVGAIKENIFGLCLAQIGGYFSIGEINTTYHKEKINYVKMEWSSIFYTIEMKNIFINDIKIDSFTKKKYQIIIDSGTTISYFPTEVFNEIVDKVKSICNSYENKNACGKIEIDKDLGPCFIFENKEHMKEGVLNYWPNFSFILGNNYNFRWTPEQYVFNESNKRRTRACMGFNYQRGKFTMGSTWMIGHEIIFDVKNKKIGFAEAYCDKTYNNKSMDDMGIEHGYPEKNISIIEKFNLIDFFINENLIGIYIVITIILFIVFVYLIIILVKLSNYNAQEQSLIPIRYDVNDVQQNEKNNKEISLVNLNSEGKEEDLIHSKYTKIST